MGIQAENQDSNKNISGQTGGLEKTVQSTAFLKHKNLHINLLCT